MPSVLPSQIRVETVRDEVSYFLPVRPLGKLRWLGLFGIGFGLVFEAVPLSWLGHFFKDFSSRGGTIGTWLPVAFMIPFFLGGLMPLGVGLLAIWGRCRVEWREKKLVVLDHAGPIRWRRRLSKGKSRLRKLSVQFGGKVNGKPVTSGPLADMGVLTAEFDQGKPRPVAIGYPREWLQALAEDLSARIGAASDVEAPEVEVVAANQARVNSVEVVVKPANSQVRVESRPDGFMLVIPPAGVWKGSKGLLPFGIFWCLFMTVFTGFVVTAAIKGSDGSFGPFWIFISIFWMIGLGLLLGAINMGRRRALLLVEAHQLSVAQMNVFGTRRWQWPRADVTAIRADASGMEVNDRAILELQIHPAAGKKVGFLGGRDEDELRWIACELRRALNVPAYAS